MGSRIPLLPMTTVENHVFESLNVVLKESTTQMRDLCSLLTLSLSHRSSAFISHGWDKESALLCSGDIRMDDIELLELCSYEGKEIESWQENWFFYVLCT